MALIDVVQWDGGDDQVAWKFPSTNLRLGSQLVVRPGQVAFFLHRGKIFDELTEGTISLQTGNIPLLTNLLSLPFGGDSPFPAEVWFINKLAKLDSKWGTSTPIQVEDPRYGIILSIRAYGQYGFRVAEARVFLESLLGAAADLTDDQIRQYFRGKIISTISSQIGGLLSGRISFLNIASHLEELSDAARIKIAPSMAQFGIQLENFYFESINVPEDDPSYVRLKQIKEKSAELNVIGRDVYQFDRSMDTLQTAAANEGLSGLMMQSGMGAGMGMMMGAQLGQQAGTLMNKLPPVNLPPHSIQHAPAFQYFIIFNNQQAGPYSLDMLQQMQQSGSFGATTMIWREGMAEWKNAATLPELLHLFGGGVPPPLPPVA